MNSPTSKDAVPAAGGPQVKGSIVDEIFSLVNSASTLAPWKISEIREILNLEQSEQASVEEIFQADVESPNGRNPSLTESQKKFLESAVSEEKLKKVLEVLKKNDSEVRIFIAPALETRNNIENSRTSVAFGGRLSEKENETGRSD